MKKLKLSKSSTGTHQVCDESGAILGEIEADEFSAYSKKLEEGAPAVLSGRERTNYVLELSEKYPGKLGDLLFAYFQDNPKIDPKGMNAEGSALRIVTLTAEGQAAWHDHVLGDEAKHVPLKPGKDIPKAEPGELELAVSRYMTDNKIADYGVALTEFCRTPRGRKLYREACE